MAHTIRHGEKKIICCCLPGPKFFPKKKREGDCVTRTEEARKKKDYKEPQDNIYRQSS